MKLAKRDDVRRWDPFREFDRLQNEISKLFDWSVGHKDRGTGLDFQWSPEIDVVDEGKEYFIKADLPGIDPKDIEITVDNGVLTIKGERTLEEEEKQKDYYCLERAYGSFSRSIQLPNEVEADKVKASYKNGVLELRCPKSARSQARKIKVES